MTIRELHDSDDAEYRQLLKYAFDWSMDDDEERANIMEFHHASAWGIGDPLVSALTAIHLDVRMGETTFKMAGVSDVASYPEASGQGNIELLMRRALDTLADQGFTLAYLMPFSAPFYRRFGFEDAITETTNEVKIARLPKVKMPAGVEVRREPWAAAIPALKTVYDRNPVTLRGGLVRQEWWWLPDLQTSRRRV